MLPVGADENAGTSLRVGTGRQKNDLPVPVVLLFEPKPPKPLLCCCWLLFCPNPENDIVSCYGKDL